MRRIEIPTQLCLYIIVIFLFAGAVSAVGESPVFTHLSSDSLYDELPIDRTGAVSVPCYIVQPTFRATSVANSKFDITYGAILKPRVSVDPQIRNLNSPSECPNPIHSGDFVGIIEVCVIGGTGVPDAFSGHCIRTKTPWAKGGVDGSLILSQPLGAMNRFWNSGVSALCGDPAACVVIRQYNAQRIADDWWEPTAKVKEFSYAIRNGEVDISDVNNNDALVFVPYIFPGGVKEIVPKVRLSAFPYLCGGQVSLNWTSSILTQAAADSGYIVYRATSSTGPFTRLNNPSGQPIFSTKTHTDTGLVAGQTYYYKVSAINSTGFEGATSDVVSVLASNVCGDYALSARTSSACGGGVDLSWTAIPTATAYSVYRSTTLAGTYTKIGQVSSTDFRGTFTDIVPVSGQSYYYKVVGVNGQGADLPASTVISVSSSAACAITNFESLPAQCGGKALLTWTTATNAVEYKLFRSGLANPRIIPSVSFTGQYADVGLTAGASYTYSLKAYDRDGAEISSAGPITVIASAACTGVTANSVTAQGVRICGAEYFCGDADGVCPEMFRNADGQRPSCAAVPDVDCPPSVTSGFFRRTVSLAFEPLQSQTFITTPATNSQADLVTSQEFIDSSESYYSLQMTVDSYTHQVMSMTTITLHNVSAPQFVLFDYAPLVQCIPGENENCYTFTFNGPDVTLSIYHPLSRHLITAQFPIAKRLDFPYILLTIFVCIISLVFITRKFIGLQKDEERMIQRLDLYIEQQRKKGLNDKTIKEKLLTTGWKKTQIDKELSKKL